MCEVEGQFILVSLVVLRGVLVEIVEDALALAGVPEAHGVGSVLGHALVVHRRVGAVVDVVVPFVHADAQRGGAEGL